MTWDVLYSPSAGIWRVWSCYDAPGYADARCEYLQLAGRDSPYRHIKFRLVNSDQPSTSILPLEFTMPWTCALCASEHPASDDALEVLDDATHRILAVCGTCYRRQNQRCSCCRVVITNPAQPSGEPDGFICHECTDHHFQCGTCHIWRNAELRRELPGGTETCRQCFDREWASCGHCGATCRRDDFDDGMCPRCARGRVIRSHSYKPRAKFFGRGPLYFGVELEVECGNRATPADVAHEIVNELGDGFVYAKHDGSLDHGFEVVSHPFSEDWFNESGKALWTKLLKQLKSSGCRSYDTQTCGMHVHVTRDALTPQELLRLQRLSHNNPDLILLLSRRRKDNLERWANPRDTDIREHYQLAVGAAGHKRNRYAAINVTGKTVELRIFRGTCEEDGFFGNLEAVRSLVEFSKQEIGLFPRARDYFTYVKSNKEKYPNLLSTILRDAVPA